MGCERSGTTFLGSLIGSHPECIVTPESQFKTYNYSEKEKQSFDPEKTFKNIQNHRRFQHWDTDIFFTKSEFNQIKNYSDLLLNIVKKYNINKQNKTSAKIWVDHSPQNIKHVDFLKSLYPNAKFIHIIRDGRAVAASHQNITWGPRGMKNIANYWLQKLAYGFASETKYPKNVLSIRYEDLLANTEITVKKITNFIDLKYESSMLEANELIIPNYTKYQHKLVGGKADISRINSWKQTLSKREIELFEYETKNMLNLLGYNTIFTEPTREKRYERILLKLKYKYIRFRNKQKKI